MMYGLRFCRIGVLMGKEIMENKRQSMADRTLG